MPTEGLRELYVDQLKDLYNAENQLVKALPKMAKASSSEELREGFEEHLEQTKGHVQRLEQIFKMLNENPKGKRCRGMEGLVEEGSEIMQEDFEDALLDAALIGAAQRVEHYEIATYGPCVRSQRSLVNLSTFRYLRRPLKKKRKRTRSSLNLPSRSMRRLIKDPGKQRRCKRLRKRLSVPRNLRMNARSWKDRFRSFHFALNADCYPD